jgi:putative DNA-invertase from lambdoid prophage Rac
MTAALYARVSTQDQKCEIQKRELGDRAAREGWTPVLLVEKESTRKRRPVLEQLLRDAVERRYDVILVWKLDRFGRTFEELISNIGAVDRAGVRFICTSQTVDTDQRNPVSRLTIHMLAAFAEFERDLRKERCDEGTSDYRRAYKTGQVGTTVHSRSKKDLPIGRPKLVVNRGKIEAMRAAGYSYRAIGEKHGLSHTSVKNLLAA